MRIIFKILCVVILLYTIAACRTKTNIDSNTLTKETIADRPPKPCEERSNPLDIVDNNDTLKILIQISDCGEWGGHRESIILHRDSDDRILARFIMDTVPCGRIIEKGGYGVLDDKTRVIILDTTKLLNLGDEKLMSEFLQRLLELYLKNEVHSNAGSQFQVINTNSTLYLSYWNSGDCRDTYYGKIRQQVFGDILKLKKK
jgi:hypothetical protein